MPVVLVTGSNGKTTVVRLLAAIDAGRARGRPHVDRQRRVLGDRLADGDYSGPGGARLLLRQPEVEVAVLETARGGLLRRGLEVERAAVAVVTNIADDHLGEFGIESLDQLAGVKLLSRGRSCRGARSCSTRTIPCSASGPATVGGPVVWFSLDARGPGGAHLAAGGRAAFAKAIG